MFVEHKEQGKVTEAPAKTMKLSEAIRIGASKRPQCRGVLFDGRATCAIGAGLEGLGFDLSRLNTISSKDFLSAVSEVAPVLITGGDVNNLFSRIGIMNDSGDTRERVADWLESQGY